MRIVRFAAGWLCVLALPSAWGDAPARPSSDEFDAWAGQARRTLAEYAALSPADAVREVQALRVSSEHLFEANRLALLFADSMERAGRLEEALALYEAHPSDDPLAGHAKRRALIIYESLKRESDLESATFDFMERYSAGPFREEAALRLVRFVARNGTPSNRAGEIFERLKRQRALSAAASREIAFHVLRVGMPRATAGEAGDSLLAFLKESTTDDWAVQALRRYRTIFPADGIAAREDLAWLAANVLFENREFEEAAARFAAFVERFSDSRHAEEARFLLGRSLFQERRDAEAMEVFNSLADSKVWRVRALYWQALLHERAGNPKAAVEALTHGAAVASGKEVFRDDVNAKLAQLYRQAGDEAKALKHIRAIRPGGKNRFWERLMLERGIDFYLAQDDSSAVRTFEEVWKRSPLASFREEGAFWLGRLAQKRGAEAEATLWYSRVLDMNPSGYFADLLVRDEAARWSEESAPGRTAFLAARALRAPPEEPPPFNGHLRVSLPAPLVSEPIAEPALRTPLQRARYLTALGLASWAVHEWNHHLALRGALTADDVRDAAVCARLSGDYHLLARLAERAASAAKGGERAAAAIRYGLYPIPYADFLLSAGCRERVDPLLIASIMREESRFNPKAKSWAAARGLMQFIPSTGRRYAEKLGIPFEDETVLYDPESAIRLGAAYLADLLKRFGGDAHQAAAGYNAGETRVDDWRRRLQTSDPAEFIARIPFLETRNYVKRVLNSYTHYRALYGEGMCPDGSARAADGATAGK